MIVDCFRFCHEIDLLEIRLNTLDPVVDRFVIAESPWTFSGRRKALILEDNIHRFDRWLDKIRRITIEDMPANAAENWVRDKWQLNALFRGLPALKDDDIVLVSDLDEIPNPEIIRNFDRQIGIAGLHAYHSQLFINTECYTIPWGAGRIATWRVANSYGPSRMRDFNGLHLKNGGWHFSYCGGLESFITKVTSYSYSSKLPKEWSTVKWVTKLLSDPTRYVHSMMGQPLRLREIDKTFPEYVQSHQQDLEKCGLLWSSKTAGQLTIDAEKMLADLFLKAKRP